MIMNTFMHARTIGMLALGLALGAASNGDAACGTGICTGSGNSCTIGNTTINANECPCTIDWGSSMDVTVSGLVSAADGCAVTLSAHSFDITGTIRSQAGSVTLNTSGSGDPFVKTRSTGNIDVKKGGLAVVNAAGACTISGGDVNADGVSPNCSGGFINMSCASLTVTKAIHADGACTGDDSGDGGWIWLTATSGNATLSGSGAISAIGAGSGTWGGWLSIDAAGTLSQGKSMQARGGTDGTGGDVELYGSAITIDGALNTSAAGEEGEGGTIYVDGAEVTSNSIWTNNGGSWDAGSVDVFGTGDIDINAAINANASNGGSGGSITVAGDQNVTIDGAISADGGGEDSSGGTIDLTAGMNHTLAVNRVLSAVASSGGWTDGWTFLDACNVSITNDVRTRVSSVGGGRNWMRYKGTLTLTSGDNLLADDPAATSCTQGNGNVILCRCPDTNADLVCDSQTCVSAPTLSGTVTPTALICPTVLPACG
jgi:fibronectin-binding autotransporter adhesin